MSKSGFLLGFVSGVAATAYTVYQKLDADKRQDFTDNAKKMVNDVKNRAVDYTFYARDSFDDLKDKVNDKTDEVKDTIHQAADKVTDKANDKVDEYADNKTTQFHQAADNLRNDLKEEDNGKEEDIVIDGGFIHQGSSNK
ncbi:YtxH domain-containing protein [Apilactobacillus ozensis]|uniref:YtxH domain-containing protein n=1 Tax=Apilactobacillus ozensis DSM 23829 = JCM 17196 TaxID=1423781 RepID=A0A0R2B081_9LACO|nr:YtxH domain-containing protein [Apilactobacillus ozensis]KRM68396.1 hypothetical protein FD06_GL001175 [Apilactobacillus ozensis DSM 23829 = JCM 17196]MCK8607664.1 YtxH domain-containing protein [Apilactobacillus ozensis]